MSDAVERMVEVNGAGLNMRIEGPPAAPVVALVNSLATDLTLWDAQVPALTPTFRVLRYDARGHGKSAAPAGPYSLDLLADDLMGLLAKLGVKRAHLAGVSLGGLTAMQAALRHPARVGSIVACDCRADMPPEFARGIDDRNALVRREGMQAIVNAMVERWFTAETLRAEPPALARIRHMIGATSVAGFTGCAEAIKNSGLRPRVKDITVPALFVVGAHDAALPVELMRAMQQEVQGSELTVIDAAGHLPNVERPDAFNAALLAWLNAKAG
jgi:3-oxoadipate enol-lactonase